MRFSIFLFAGMVLSAFETNAVDLEAERCDDSVGGIKTVLTEFDYVIKDNPEKRRFNFSNSLYCKLTVEDLCLDNSTWLRKEEFLKSLAGDSKVICSYEVFNLKVVNGIQKQSRKFVFYVEKK